MGVEVAAARMLADLITQLPGAEEQAAVGTFQLLDHHDDVICSWGTPQAESQRFAAFRQSIRLPVPLEHLQIELTPSPYLVGESAWQGQIRLVLVPCILCIAILGIYFMRETTRATRDAQQRVSFVNHVSHELRTPLTNIRMYAEMAEARVHDERSKRYLGVIVTESHRLGRLIANVLSFSRHQRGELRFDPTPVRIDDELQLIVEQARPLLEGKGVTLSLQLRAPAIVLADTDILAQIVGNLLGNAEKYADGAPVRLQSEQQGQMTRITVADLGPGVPAKDQERIFGAFVRLADGLSDSAGTGLGLAPSAVNWHGAMVATLC